MPICVTWASFSLFQELTQYSLGDFTAAGLMAIERDYQMIFSAT
jgi:hypothetical protein